jgi:peptidoglycan/xylan/chitin deacetylase (PgdA/CDA1 family)
MTIEQTETNWNKNPLILRIIGMGKSYFVKTPWWLKRIYPGRVWDIDTAEKIIYLTFDDGPHPVATPFVLDELKKYNAEATFFCIGKNVAEYPEIYKRILHEGHRTGNHTQNHLNGWKSRNDVYLDNIAEAANYIDSELFRPPYGRIKKSQAKKIGTSIRGKEPKIIMWTVLSGDFDTTISKEQCLKNVLINAKAGSIIVFHDSEKAYRLLEYTLPKALQILSEKGYQFEKL